MNEGEQRMNLKPLSVFPTESVDVWKVRVLPVKVTALEDPVCSPSVRIIALLEPSEKVIKLNLLRKMMVCASVEALKSLNFYNHLVCSSFLFF